MLKIEKEYNEKYSDIPSEYDERIKYICEKTKLELTHPKVVNSIEYIKNIEWEKIEYTIYLLPKAIPVLKPAKEYDFDIPIKVIILSLYSFKEDNGYAKLLVS